MPRPRLLPKLLLPLLLLSTLVIALNARLEPTEEMAAQTRWAVNVINSNHFLGQRMQQLDGTEMVEAYVASFDHSKMYFTRQGVDTFTFRFAEAMDEFLEKGNLYAAFEIYETYKERVQARTEWVYQHLKTDFDFTVDASFTPDRREADWPADQAAAETLWEKRIKYEVLNEMLALAAQTKNEDEGVSLQPKNPDLVEIETDDFNPEKLRRLVEDDAFHADILDQAREKIRRRYERNLSITLNRRAADVQESFINAMTQLFDPHSSFLSADTLESFNSAVQNSFVGIGALLQDEDGITTIKEILPGGPAEASGKLEPEDQILAVGQGEDGEFEDIVDMQLRYVVRKIKGEKGTMVRLRIRPGDAADPSVRKIVKLERDEVKLTANLATAKLISVPTKNGSTVPVGVIELPSFYGNIGAGGTLATTSADVAELLNKLRDANAAGIILDLRMNGGGLLSEAVRVAGLFIPVGPVVQVLDSEGEKDVLSDRDPRMLWDGPLIVLTSRFSASASEIVTGALRDHERALIVGNSATHGKGTVQEVYHMNTRTPFSFFQNKKEQTRPVASKITIKQFYLPEGSSTQLRGVRSDIVLPSVNEFLPIGESDLDHALPWDEIEPIDWINDWEKVDVASPEEEDLRQSLVQASENRQQNLEEFAYLKKQIEWRRERYEEDKVSLRLDRRIEKKISEQKYVQSLEATFKELKEATYPAETIITEAAAKQEAISEENKAKTKAKAEGGDESSTKTADSEDSGPVETENDEPPFDIYLRESARIMADWVQRLGPDAQTAQTTR